MGNKHQRILREDAEFRARRVALRKLALETIEELQDNAYSATARVEILYRFMDELDKLSGIEDQRHTLRERRQLAKAEKEAIRSIRKGKP